MYRTSYIQNVYGSIMLAQKKQSTLPNVHYPGIIIMCSNFAVQYVLAPNLFTILAVDFTHLPFWQ